MSTSGFLMALKESFLERNGPPWWSQPRERSLLLPRLPAQKRARCVHWELLGNVGLWDWCDQDTKRRSQKGLILIVDIFYNYCQKFGPLPSPQMLLIISGVTKTRGFNCPVPASPASISRSISKWLAQEEEGSPPGSLPHAWGRVDD